MFYYSIFLCGSPCPLDIKSRYEFGIPNIAQVSNTAATPCIPIGFKQKTQIVV